MSEFVERLRRCGPHLANPCLVASTEENQEFSQAVGTCFDRLVDRVLANARAGKTNPHLPLMTNQFAEQPRLEDSLSGPACRRVGVLPLTANPFHWGHVLTALACIAQLHLDCVVFLVQRRIDYKSIPPDEQLDVHHRHQMVERGIKDFFPLLRNTDVAMRNSKIGEQAILDLARLNFRTGRGAEFVGIWGTESSQRVRKIMSQLVEALSSHDVVCELLRLSIAFVDRPANETPLTEATIGHLASEVSLPVAWRFLQTVGTPAISSTTYRRTRNPAFVPPGVHEYVLARNLYGSECGLRR